MSHLTCWNLPAIYPFKLKLLWSCSSCLSPPTLQTKTLTNQPCSPQLFPHIHHYHNQSTRWYIPQQQSVTVLFSHRRQSALTSLRTPLTFTPQNHQRAPLKFPRYIPQWRVLYAPAEVDRQTDSPLQNSPLIPWAPEPGSRKQVSEVWREQKQLWEACLHWPVVTATSGSSAGH